jgi:ureidoglycolate hydrolase
MPLSCKTTPSDLRMEQQNMSLEPSHRRAFLVGATAAAVAPIGSAEAQTTNPFSTRGPAPTTSLALHTRHRLRAETVTPAGFAPFGVVLTSEGRSRLPINTYGARMDLYREAIETDQPIEWFIIRAQDRGTSVLFLERHRMLSQAFIPVGPRGFFTIVAAPDAPERDGLPELGALHAFWVPPGAAIQLHRSTWHENPMPAENDTHFLVTSHAALTLAHQQNPDPALAALPLDLERRWYRAAGFDIAIEPKS